MLKKRILASTMASVMALGSVSLVAFADDAAEEIKTEAVTKDQLQDYVDSFDEFLEDGIFEYGSTHGTQFQDAIDYAEGVLDDNEATADDYTAAYQMVKSVRATMKNYTKAQLQDLLDEYFDIYDGENILNADIGDIKYDQGKYDTFYAAYQDAEDVVDSEDGRLITDAYIELETAKKNLKELSTVTKAAFLAAWREYTNLITKFDDYEDWRRGTCSVNPSTNDHTKKHQKLTDEEYITFGTIKAIVTDDSTDSFYKRGDDCDSSKCKEWFKGAGDLKIQDFIEAQYEIFDKIESAGITSDTKINNAYWSMKEAVKVFNGWTADNTKRANKGSIASTINKYRAELVHDFAADVANSIAAEHSGKFDAYDGEKLKVKDKNGVEISVTDTNPKFVQIGDDGLYDKSADDNTLKVAKGQDVVKYIPVKSGDVAAMATVAADIDTNITNATNDIEKSGGTLAGYNTAKTAAGTPLATGGYDATILALFGGADNAAKQAEYDKIIGFDKDYKVTVEYEPASGSAVNDEITYKTLKVTDPADGVTVTYASGKDLDAVKAAVTTFNEKITKSSDSSGVVEKAAALNTDISELQALKDLKTKIAEDAVDGKDTIALWGRLEAVLTLVEKYEDAEKITDSDDRKAAFVTAYGTELGGLDTLKTVVNPNGSVAEYTLINRELTYVLHDLYDEEADAKYTRADVRDLIEDCNELLDKTIDAEVFSQNHLILKEATRAAIEWKTKAYKSKTYKDGEPVEYTPEYAAQSITTGMTSTEVYETLDGYREDLEEQYKAYPVSYGQVKDFIAVVATGLDSGAYKSGADDIKTLLAKVSVGLSTLDAENDDNEAFTDERKFIPYNRVQTAKDEETGVTPSDAEKQLNKDYEALVEAVEEATKAPEKGTGDVDGDGVLTLDDCLMILDYYVGAITFTDDQIKAADVDGDGVATLDDSLKILEAYIAL